MQTLNDTQALGACLDASAQGPVFIFKHSTRCPTSAMARSRVTRFIADGGDHLPPFREVLVVEARPVSNAVAERLGVTHQSPQLILVYNGQAAWSATHGAITAAAIEEALGEIPKD